MNPVLLAFVLASRAEIGPVYVGVVDDWRDGLRVVGTGPLAPSLVLAARGAIQAQAVPGGIALLADNRLTLCTRKRVRTFEDPQFRGAVFAGYVGSFPVLRTETGLLVSPLRSLSRNLPGSEASMFRSGGSATFTTYQEPAPVRWRVRVARGAASSAWPATKGSIEFQSMLGDGLLVSADTSTARPRGSLVMFRPGKHPRVVLRQSNARFYFKPPPERSRVWIAAARYEEEGDHVASSSRVFELAETGKPRFRFSVPFEFRPWGLDDTHAWLLGIRMRGLHAGASELIAIRLRDRAIKTLRPATLGFLGLTQ